jgi:uncharacterized membrane protein YqiK
MDAMHVFLIVIAAVAIFMLYVMLWWPAATVGALIIATCTFGVFFLEEEICSYTPDDAMCAEYNDQ